MHADRPASRGAGPAVHSPRQQGAAPATQRSRSSNLQEPARGAEFTAFHRERSREHAADWPDSLRPDSSAAEQLDAGVRARTGRASAPSGHGAKRGPASQTQGARAISHDDVDQVSGKAGEGTRERVSGKFARNTQPRRKRTVENDGGGRGRKQGAGKSSWVCRRVSCVSGQQYCIECTAAQSRCVDSWPRSHADMLLATGKTTEPLKPFEPYVQTYCGIGPVDPTLQHGETAHPDNGFYALHVALEMEQDLLDVRADVPAGTAGRVAEVLQAEVWPRGATAPAEAILLALRVQGPGTEARARMGDVLDSLGLPPDCAWVGEKGGERVPVAKLTVGDVAARCMRAGCERLVLKQ